MIQKKFEQFKEGGDFGGFNKLGELGGLGGSAAQQPRAPQPRGCGLAKKKRAQWGLLSFLALLAFGLGAAPMAHAASRGGAAGAGGGRSAGAGRAGMGAIGISPGIARFGGASRAGAAVSPRIANGFSGKMVESQRGHHDRFRHRNARNNYYNAPYFSGYPYYPYYYDYPYLGYAQQYFEMPLDYPDAATAAYSGSSSYPGEGASLRQVQSVLAREGYYQGAADGVMGPMTREAIENYQRDHRLTVTGKVTSAMLSRMGL